MSIAIVSTTKTLKRNNAVKLNFKALSALASGDKQYESGRYGAQLVSDKNDSRTAIVIKNTHSADVSVNLAQGNSPYCAESPLVISVPTASEVVIVPDSALYKDLSIDGYVLYTTDANFAKIEVACIALP